MSSVIMAGSDSQRDCAPACGPARFFLLCGCRFVEEPGSAPGHQGDGKPRPCYPTPPWPQIAESNQCLGGWASIKRPLSAFCRGGNGCGREASKGSFSTARKEFPKLLCLRSPQSHGGGQPFRCFWFSTLWHKPRSLHLFFCRGVLGLDASPQHVEPATALHMRDWPLRQCQGWGRAHQSPCPTPWGRNRVQNGLNACLAKDSTNFLEIRQISQVGQEQAPTHLFLIPGSVMWTRRKGRKLTTPPCLCLAAGMQSWVLYWIGIQTHSTPPSCPHHRCCAGEGKLV